MSPKKLTIWGSTGSIGRQTLDVVNRYQERFEIVSLTAHHNASLLLEQARKFRPRDVVITGDVREKKWEEEFRKLGVKLLRGKDGLLEIAARGGEDLIVNALVGGVGLEPTIIALGVGVPIALANKEVLVMAGELVTMEAEKHGTVLLPVDSEHSAIFQCLQGEENKSIKKIFLTASGGPFLKRNKSELSNVTVEAALAHPNWRMGKKVTIDSATLMNKGFEVIEARWLFGIDPDKIEVVIHPQSIIHSMVEFVDGSIKAQMGVPDMRIPISYALAYPERWAGDYGWMDFTKIKRLEFFPPDMEKYPTLNLAYQALEMGGTAPAVLSGADEIAVDFFISKKISFPEISQIIGEVLNSHKVILRPEIDDILQTYHWAREVALRQIETNL